MIQTTEFAPGDRYRYDFGVCSASNGFAQVDTDQDASYFGTWANPMRRIIFTYCEGDCSSVQCESDEEFVSELRRIDHWNVDNGYRHIGIDAGFNTALYDVFERLGLLDLNRLRYSAQPACTITPSVA